MSFGPIPAWGHMPFIGHRTCADWKHESDRPHARPLVRHETKVLALAETHTVAMIAKRFGVAPSSVYTFLARHGARPLRRAA